MKTFKIHWFVAGWGGVMLSVGASIAPGFAQVPAVQLVPGSTPALIVEPSIIQQFVIIAQSQHWCAQRETMLN
jgi:hypothetical protein